ncbi:hypothetical protein S7335_4886 [Synechococcus sp. PCC 7335]|nr:hypothetical protein S7335_4886 [Synechococcus sp. PCC 7335]
MLRQHYTKKQFCRTVSLSILFSDLCLLSEFSLLISSI